MSLHDAFGEVVVRFRAMHVALERLQTELEAGEEMAITARTMLEVLEQAIAAAERGQRAATPPVDLDRATGVLPRCQQRFNFLLDQLRTEIGSPSRMDTLAATGRPAAAWALNRCYQPFMDASWALSACQRELAEYTLLVCQGSLPGPTD